MEWAYRLGGLVSIASGVFLLVSVLAFSTLVDPDLPVADQNAQRFERITDSEGGPTLVSGVLLILAGGWLAFSKPRPSP